MIKTAKVFFCILFCIILFNCKTVQQSIVIEKPVPPPDETPARVKFGMQLESFLLQGDYEKALQLFENLSEEDSADIELKSLKLSILISANKLKEATKYADELEKFHPDEVSILYSQAMIAQATNKSKQKTAYLKKILAKKPSDSWALTEMGLDLYGQRNYREAGKKFAAALKSSPETVEALIGLARVYYMQNKLKQAEKSLNKALQYRPKSSVALAELARVKSETNRMPEAFKDIKKAIELDPGIPSHWMDLGSYSLQIGEKEQAKEAFDHVVSLTPDSYVAYIYRAGVNDDLGFKDEALADYKKINKLYPEYYFAFEGAGIILWEKGLWNEARLSFTKALEKSPSAYQYALMISCCWLKMGKTVEAKKFMQQFLKTIDRSKNENQYFLCRLFADFAGENDVYSRILNEKNKAVRCRMMFYLGCFNEALKHGITAEKYYLETTSCDVPSFFEYRLAEHALKLKIEQSGAEK